MTMAETMIPIALITAVAGATAPAADTAQTPDPLALYGEAIEFDVLRNGKIVGEHVTRFDREGEALTVRSEMSLKVQVMLLFTYRMEYEAEEVWRDGRLTELEVDASLGGDSVEIDGERQGDRFTWSGPEGEYSASLPLFSTNHWNADVVRSEQVLNTLTGKLNDVTIPREEWEMVAVGEGWRPAYRYRYQGDLTNEVWYDAEGRWVKLRFEAEDGSTIEYRCRRCG